MLTTVSHRELIGGLFLTEFVVWGGFLALLLVPGAAAFGLGVGSAQIGLRLFVVSGFLLVLALQTGFVVALVIRNMGARSVLLTRLRNALFVVLALLYFGVLFTQAFETLLDPIYTVIAPTPIGWSADLVLFGITSDASLSRAVGTIGFGMVFVVGSWVALTWLSQALWYTDGVHVTHSYDHDPNTDEWLERVLPRPMAGVVSADWTRARRAPITLSFVLYPLLILIGPLMAAIDSGRIGTGFPLWVLLCGAWITGALFTLNVLGHEGAVLPITLLSNSPEWAIIGGHMFASLLIGLPLTLIATLSLTILSPHGLTTIITIGISVIILTISAVLIAIGVGTRFPRFDEVTVTRSTTAVVPSMFSFGLYSLLLGIVAMPTLISHSILGEVVSAALGYALLTIHVAGIVLSGVLGLGLGVICIWYARRQIVRFDLDRKS